VEDLTGVGSCREERVIAEHVGITEARALLVITVDGTDRRVEVDRHLLLTRSRAERPGAGKHRLGELVELTDVSEAAAPEEGPERRRRHHLVTEHGCGRTRAEHVGILDAVRPDNHRVHERRHAAPGKRRDVDELLAEEFETELFAQHTDE
jgi:hypothetical protein